MPPVLREKGASFFMTNQDNGMAITDMDLERRICVKWLKLSAKFTQFVRILMSAENVVDWVKGK